MMNDKIKRNFNLLNIDTLWNRLNIFFCKFSKFFSFFLCLSHLKNVKC